MKITRWITIITLLVLLFPTQAALAHPIRALSPSVQLTPFTATTQVNKTVTYQVTVSNVPSGGLHCARIEVQSPAGFKVYPASGYSYYHFYGPATLNFTMKAPATAQRKFFYARVSWSRDYMCRSVRTFSFSNQVEIIVKK